MSKVSIQKQAYAGWENCMVLSNGIVDLVATTDVGPRIIRFGFCGKENEFCEMQEQIGRTGDSEWHIYGGHRLWHSPEQMPRSYSPDNSPIECRKIKNGLVLDQPVEPWTQIKKEIEVVLSPDKAEAYLLHRLTNKGAWEVELAAWALTVMAPGGMEILPQSSGGDPLLPNRMISLWTYTRLNDRRVYLGEKYITLQQDTSAKQPFKIGFPNRDGWAAYANHNHLFVKQFDMVDDAVYPDYSASSYETYTNERMLEMESLSPLALLAPGEFIEHREVWKLFDGVEVPLNEDEIDKKILPLARKQD